MMGYNLHRKAAAIVKDAGGRLVGRTRFQKVVYLTQLAGFMEEFSFEYRFYGPYSETLTEAMEIAVGLGIVAEEEKESASGAYYSIYRIGPGFQCEDRINDARTHFVQTAASVGAIALELAATAAFLHVEQGFGREGKGDPWELTARHKPGKAANGRLDHAKRKYETLRGLDVPNPLPLIG